MVNDGSDSGIGNPLPPLGLLFPNRSKGEALAGTRNRHKTHFLI